MNIISLSEEEKINRIEQRYLLKYNKEHKEINGVIFKHCSRHNEYFPNEDSWIESNEDNFYPSSNSKEGLNPYCKKCEKFKNAKYTKEHPEMHAKAMKKITNTEHTKLVSGKRSKRRRADGSFLEWQRSEQGKASSKKSREKRQYKEHTINEKEWQSCKEYFNYDCAYCGIHIENNYFTRLGITKLGDFHKEHVNHEGSNELDNCVPSCQSCNSSKHEYNIEEWYVQQDSFSEDRLNKIYRWINGDWKKFYIEKKLKKPRIKKENLLI